jgi:hypothetical protein
MVQGGTNRVHGADQLLHIPSFSVWMQLTVPTGKKSEHPRGMPLITRLQELQASAGVGTNGILECKCLSKTEHRTFIHLQRGFKPDNDGWLGLRQVRMFQGVGKHLP